MHLIDRFSQLLRCEVALHFYKYLIYEWSNLRVLLEASSATRLTLCMCHGCFYTGIFVFDYHAHDMSIEQKSHIEIFRKGSVQEFYRLKALMAFEQVISSVLQKKRKKYGYTWTGFSFLREMVSFNRGLFCTSMRDRWLDKGHATSWQRPWCIVIGTKLFTLKACLRLKW